MRTRAAAVCAATLVGVATAWPVVGQGQVAPRRAQLPVPPSAVSCLHNGTSTAKDRARRDQALRLARAINAAEGQAAQQTRKYAPLAQLPGLPPVPDGFQLRFYTDGEGYVLSLKDSRDPCHYGVFSDQQGLLYEVTPGVPLIAS